MPKPSTHTAAQRIHINARNQGHDIIWTLSREIEGYVGRCINPNCRLTITVDDDDKDELTQEHPLPSCPLNSSL